ncbi:inositol monophosphatase family protein [Vibrio sp. MA40-2]|uniref:inositol monophosphatase family protein n=1 Tax=Vibrio sp. MA40-2 TaxID=3391828 RepID=UPI0039A78670
MKIADKLEVLEKAIRAAGNKARALRKQGLSIETKGKNDFVTQADLAVETEIKNVLTELFPRSGFLGEESGLTEGNEGVWVIDPIDGTTNYMQGMDYWCISVAYVHNEQIELGYIYAPDRDEFFSAKKGQGAWLNGKRLVMHNEEQGQAIIGLGHSNRRPLSELVQLLKILDENSIDHRRFGAGALMLAHVASSLVHGYFEAHLNSWDALAGLLLVEEAGGYVPDFLENNGLMNGNPVWVSTPSLWPVLSLYSKQLSIQ